MAKKKSKPASVTRAKRKAKKASSARKGKNERGESPAVATAAAAGRLEAKVFPIVAVGASAGGLDAFTQLLEHLPLDTGMAFVLVQHLSPQKGSMLTELLSRTTEMPVTEVSDGMKTEPNHIYVIPPNADMAILHGVLHLMPRSESRGQHLPIDYFMRSLAQDQKARAIGLVLSGTASDGALGVKAIKAEGGITFAQDEETAKYHGMPRSAIAAGAVDFVLSPHEIAKELARIGRHPYVNRVRVDKPAQLLTEEGGDDMSKVLIAVRTATGVDFTYYKHTTLHRRVLRRMVLHKIDAIGDYVKYLHFDPGEAEALYNDILINVTSFFREPDSFKTLAEKVFPAIAKERSPEKPIRIWVPGCATGEEAYSIAICLLEFLHEKGKNIPIQIFATDISNSGIDKARSGSYPENIAADVSPDRLRRFFSKVADGYQINKFIRDMCIFARQDVTKDPPFSKLDLISCRNVLIYLGPLLQKKIMPIFHYALTPDGFLMLGSSETIGGFADLFALVDNKHKVYSKKVTATRIHFDLGAPRLPADRAMVGKGAAGRAASHFEMQNEADRLVVARYAPPGVVINEDLDILQFRGRTAPYLEPAPGEASLNVLKMARDGLMLELRSAIQEAIRDDAPVLRKGVKARLDERARSVDIEVIPIVHPASKRRHFLVLFIEVDQRSARSSKSKKASPAAGKEQELSEAKQLSQELAATKEYVQSVVEELEAANEELRSANEEIQSSNEELQSTNEELETAKEELQSTNEELTTVNEELENRNVELGLANNDLANLLASARIPIVVLGNDLRIRRFTPTAERVMSVIPSDIGRRITDIRAKVRLPDLEILVAHVLETLKNEEREVQDDAGRWYSLRVSPYRTEDRIDGVVIALIDIDAVKRTEEMRLLATVLRSSNDAITVQRFDGQILAWNRGAAKMYGYSESEALAMNIRRVIPEDRQDEATLVVERISRGESKQPFETARVTKDGRQLDVQLTANLLIDDEKKPRGIATIERDITARKRAEQALRESEARFRAAITHSPIIVSHQDNELRYTWAHKPHLGLETPVLGKRDEDLFPPGEAARLAEIKRGVLATGAGMREKVQLTVEGTAFLYDLAVEPLRDAAGEIIGITCAAMDITGWKGPDEGNG